MLKVSWFNFGKKGAIIKGTYAGSSLLKYDSNSDDDDDDDDSKCTEMMLVS